MELKAGQIWKHHKGDTYKILTLARIEADGTDVVVYERLTDIVHTGWKIWVRPIDVFFNEVEWQGKTVPRFTFLSDN
jgi:hypothetical protein